MCFLHAQLGGRKFKVIVCISIFTDRIRTSLLYFTDQYAFYGPTCILRTTFLYFTDQCILRTTLLRFTDLTYFTDRLLQFTDHLFFTDPIPGRYFALPTVCFFYGLAGPYFSKDRSVFVTLPRKSYVQINTYNKIVKR